MRCPGSGVLGRSPVHTPATSTEPLAGAWAGATTHLGGADRWMRAVGDAIAAFVDREYPDLGDERITIVPDLGMEPNSKHLISHQGRQGGLASQDFAAQPVMSR